MSIPAVLYDHVPVVDLPDEEPAGVSYFVSSMVYRIYAPREQDDDGEGDNDNERQKQPQSIEGGREDISNNSDSDSDNISDDNDGNEVVEGDEDAERPMETIIEDIDSDYVLIPIPSPATNGDHGEIFSAISRTGTNGISSTILACGSALFKATTRSSERKHRRIKKFWKANVAALRSLSGFRALQTVVLNPLHSNVRDMLSSSIYNSYDWVSETVIDGSGNRLILPGSCVALDLDEPRNIIIDDDSGNIEKTNHDDAGMLIVPSCADSTSLKHDTTTSRKSPSPSSSSMWTSNTIMVSAHDLLAVKRAQHKRRVDTDRPQPLSLFDVIEEEEQGRSHDYRYYYRDEYMNHSKIIVATTQNVTQQCSRALWKLAKRKAIVWHYIGYIGFRRSIKNVGRLLINSQQLIIKYYKSNNPRSSLLLSPPNNCFANDEYDEDNTGKQEISHSIFIVPLEKPCLQSFDGRQSSAQTMNEYDGIVDSQEDVFIIEMTPSMSNNHNEFPAL